MTRLTCTGSTHGKIESGVTLSELVRIFMKSMIKSFIDIMRYFQNYHIENPSTTNFNVVFLSNLIDM